MTRQVTIAEVAKLAGVHESTVSRALNPETEFIVNSKTVKKVKAAAESLNYVPNIMARGLRTRLSMTVGVVIPDLTNPIFPEIIRGIEKHLAPLGYTTLLTDADSSASLESSVVTSLTQRQVDGFIIATGVEDPEIVKYLDGSGLPVVLVNRGAQGKKYPLVTGNDEEGIRAATAHLAELGHKSIVHIAGPMSHTTSRGRAKALRTAADSHSMKLKVYEAKSLTVNEGERIADKAIEEARGSFTAIQASTDLLALGALRSLRKSGLRCPEDVSVVGFNDMPFADEFSPGLTTVKVPLEEIGREAARQLMRSIEEKTLAPIVVSLPVSLVIRASTGPAPELSHR